MELLIWAVVGIGSLASLVCLVWVTLKVLEQHGVLWAIAGFCCCQIGIYIWGWFAWRDSEKFPVMIVWTLASILGAVGRIMAEQQGMIAPQY